MMLTSKLKQNKKVNNSNLIDYSYNLKPPSTKDAKTLLDAFFEWWVQQILHITYDERK